MTADDLPLPTLLSRLLIAFTIEFDNEAEHRLEHRTTRGAAGGTGRGPWLVSQAMWANFMQFVQRRRTRFGRARGRRRSVDVGQPGRLQRWGYVTVGLQPYPDGWRARGPYLRQTTAVLNDPGAALPHYPMVLHRGGWPDGS